MKHYFLTFIHYIYRFPLYSGICLSMLTSLYLIHDYGVVNRSSLARLWRLQYSDGATHDALDSIILAISTLFRLDVVTSGYVLMVICHALLIALLLAIARLLYFSKLSRWALILLLLAHPSYNDFRSYIIIDPLFWCGWLLAIYLLLANYKKKTVLSIVLWFILFLSLTKISVAAWFWLLLFPFGALLFKPWRRKTVAYALLGYALIVAILLFLPIYGGQSPMTWFVATVVENPNSLVEVLGLDRNTWIKEENTLMAGVFVFSGATSLVMIRSVIVFGAICTVLGWYAVVRRQYQIVDAERFRMLTYVCFFGIFISVVLLVLDKDSGTIVSFSFILLLFLLAALGLSYVFQKMLSGQYSKLATLVIIWCLVAYIASGFIIFGPKKDYLATAGTDGRTYTDYPLYSNDPFYLFYAGKDPSRLSQWQDLEKASAEHSFYYAYEKNRNKPLPETLSALKPIKTYANSRGDKLLLYQFIRY